MSLHPSSFPRSPGGGQSCSEIADLRVPRRHEFGQHPPAAIYAEEDKLSLHRFKADEAYQIGKGEAPVEADPSI